MPSGGYAQECLQDIPITGMTMLSSSMLLPLLCPNVDIYVGDEDIGTMLVSSCKYGSICVWDAFDARIHSQQNSLEKGQDDQDRAIAEFLNVQPCGRLS